MSVLDMTENNLMVRLIGFTLLYFKMAVIPLVPETKMAGVGKVICLRNLLVRKVTWFVLTTTSAPLILSRAFGADHTTRIDYICPRIPRTLSLSLSLSLSLHCGLQRQHSLSFFPFWFIETAYIHSLSHTHFDFERQHSLSLFISTFRNSLTLPLSNTIQYA